MDPGQWEERGCWSCADSMFTLQAHFAVGWFRHKACAQQHDARPPCCGEEHLQQHGPRAVGGEGLLVLCRSMFTLRAQLLQVVPGTMPVHSSMMLDHQAVVRRGCINMDHDSGRRRAACTECCCEGKVS